MAHDGEEVGLEVSGVVAGRPRLAFAPLSSRLVHWLSPGMERTVPGNSALSGASSGRAQDRSGTQTCAASTFYSQLGCSQAIREHEAHPRFPYCKQPRPITHFRLPVDPIE